MAFPDNYPTGVMYLSVDKAESKQVHQLYAMPDAFAALIWHFRLSRGAL